jgi:glycosyltransferase involved in cell wall biosynthesis
MLDDRVHLLVAGDGPQREQLVHRAERAGLADRVHFVGVVEDILEALAPGDLFASASVVETYGIAIVEAYVAGLPVAYVQCPAVADLTHGAPHPRLVSADGTVEGLALAIKIGLEQGRGTELVADEERAWVDIGDVSGRLDDLEAAIGARPRGRPRRSRRSPSERRSAPAP